MNSHKILRLVNYMCMLRIYSHYADCDVLSDQLYRINYECILQEHYSIYMHVYLTTQPHCYKLCLSAFCD